MKILFISHEASITGAPLYLLHLCKHLKVETDWQLYFLLKSDGPLSTEFSKVGTTFFYNTQTSDNLFTKIANRLQKFSFFRKTRHRLLKNRIRSLKLDLIYSNTATNGNIIAFLADLNIKIITHVHELEGSINYYGKQNLQLVKKYSKAFVSTSKSVTAYLEYNLGINTDKILRLNCTPIHNLPENIDKASLKLSLGIPDNAFIVGTSGTVQWRKGWDLFIRLAQNVNHLDKERDFYFVWVGKFIDTNLIKLIENELIITNLKERVFFIGERINPMQHYALFDTFCLMSREEAFGIVAIECALFGIPINCFDAAEGLCDFIKNDAGFIIPNLDTYEMAKAIVILANEKEIYKRMGDNARDRVLKEYNVPIQLDKFCHFAKSILFIEN
ncbi:glycosyltransferase family 4 protein [Pontibacter populi]|uniref:Glycosyltransferase family 4 protein n=1 Tax=Pontibacter populi TaxID=890055 RepID=A0ABV1RW05_9BACT